MDQATIYRRRWWTLGVLCISLLIIVLDNTVLNVALPTLVRELHASASQLEWIVDSYILVFAGLLLTAGSLGDRFGRRGALAIGLIIFGAGSLMSAFANSANMLIATRAFMGIGGAFVMPATLSILTNTFTDNRERAKAIGLWSAVSAIGIALGPLLGGLLLEHFSWGSVFLVNVPIVIFGLVGGQFLVPTSKDPEAPRVDVMGAVLSITGLGSLLYGIIEGPARGWSDGAILGSFVAAAAILLAFIIWESRTTQPMLDIRFFKNPRFSAASASIALIFFALAGSTFYMSQYLQSVLGYSTLRSGASLIPIAVAIIIAAPQAPHIAHRIGSKVVVTAGLLTFATGLVILSRMTVDSGYGIVGVGLAVLGLGMGLTMAPATESIMGSLPLGKAGVGSAVNDTTRQVGGALGVALLGSIATSQYTSAMKGATAKLPGNMAATASNSIGGALSVSRSIGGRPGQDLTVAAQSAFVNAMSHGLLLGAGIGLVGACVAFAFLPARAREHPGTFAPESEVTDQEAVPA